MRYRILRSFEQDYRKLPPEHRAVFQKVVRRAFAPACDAWAEATAARRAYVWPKSLRVDELVNGNGVMEMTWNFASPDGRATFKLAQEDGDFVCVWRRIGDHGIFGSP